LALFVIKQLPGDLLNQLIDQISQATRQHGLDLLSKHPDFNLIHPQAWETTAVNFGLPDKERLWLAIGLRLITVEDVMRVASNLSNYLESVAIKVFSQGTSEPSPSEPAQPSLKIDSDLIPLKVELVRPSEEEAERNFYEICITLSRADSGRLGILAAVTQVIKDHHGNIKPGSSVKLHPDTGVIQFFIEKDPMLDLEALVDDLTLLELHRRDHPLATAGRPKVLNMVLEDVFGTIHEVLDRLRRLKVHVVGLTLDPYQVGGVESLEISLNVPPDVSDEKLNSEFQQWLGPGVIQLVNKPISEATADEILRIVKNELEENDFLRKSIRSITEYLFHPSAPTGEVDWAFVNDFRKALALAKKWHAGQKRKSGRPYIIHILTVTDILIRNYKVRDPMILLTSLLHDTLEDGPANLLLQENEKIITAMHETDIQEYFLKKQGEIIQEIQTELPAYGRTLTDLIQRISYNKGVEPMSAHFQRILAAQSDLLINLKFADRQHNLTDVFRNIDFARRYIGEATRFYLPLVMAQFQARDDVYLRSRQLFLSMLIHRSLHKRLPFLSISYQQKEDRVAVNRATASTLHDFVAWLEKERKLQKNNKPNCLPPLTDVSDKQMIEYIRRLQDLEKRLSQPLDGGGGRGSANVSIYQEEDLSHHEPGGKRHMTLGSILNLAVSTIWEVSAIPQLLVFISKYAYRTESLQSISFTRFLQRSA
jgi:hypothetical protein